MVISINISIISIILYAIFIKNYCPNFCNNNGNCVDNICICKNDFKGTDCSVELECDNNCSDNGYCDPNTNKCLCYPGYSGSDCSIKTNCPKNCSDIGTCIDNKCICPPNYGGIDCSEKTCEKCVNGICNPKTGECVCDLNFNGPTCESKLCFNNCTDEKHGRCEDGKCICTDDYEDIDCSKTKPIPAVTQYIIILTTVFLLIYFIYLLWNVYLNWKETSNFSEIVKNVLLTNRPGEAMRSIDNTFSSFDNTSLTDTEKHKTLDEMLAEIKARD